MRHEKERAALELIDQQEDERAKVMKALRDEDAVIGDSLDSEVSEDLQQEVNSKCVGSYLQVNVTVP